MKEDNEKKFLFKPNDIVTIVPKNENTIISRDAFILWNIFLRNAKKKIKYSNQESCEFELDLKETFNDVNISTANINFVQESLLKLMEPVVGVNSKNDVLIAFSPVPVIKLDRKENKIFYELSKPVLELLKKNRIGFTKLNISEMVNFQSRYSIILFEYISKYKNLKEIPEISIVNLRQITGTNNKRSFDRFTFLKKRILDVAIEEINKHSCLKVRYEIFYKPTETKPCANAIKFIIEKDNEVEITERNIIGDIYTSNSSLDEQEFITNEVNWNTSDEVMNTLIQQVDKIYSSYADKFAMKGLLNEDEFYDKTLYFPLVGLVEHFFEKREKKFAKIDKKWLENSIAKKYIFPRYDDQKEFYNVLLECLNDIQRNFFKTKIEGKYGFLSVVLRLMQMVNPNEVPSKDNISYIVIKYWF